MTSPLADDDGDDVPVVVGWDAYGVPVWRWVSPEVADVWDVRRWGAHPP